MLKKAADYIYRYIPIIAFFFAIIYLINIDIKNFKINLPLFILSVICLLSLFFFRVYIWFVFLRKFDPNITFSVCIVGRFKFILAKYIPGKFWQYLGAGLVQEKYTKISLIDGTVNAITFQLANSLSGFLIGSIGIVIYLEYTFIWLYIFLLIFVFTIIYYFLLREREIVSFIWLQKIKYLKKYTKTFSYKLPACADIFLLLLLQWLLLGASYYLFFKAAFFNVGISTLFFQPLANNIGMIAIFAPGGLGVREGFMVFYLSRMGFHIEEAALMAIISRFWFFLVEAVAFAIGLIVEKNMIYSKTI